MSELDLRSRAMYLYASSNGKMAKRRIADCVGVSAGTISRWAREDGWNTLQETVVSIDGEKMNLHDAEIDLSDVLPNETCRIMNRVEHMSSAEILWQLILLQYTAIIRAQRALFASDECLTVENKALSKDEINSSEPWVRNKFLLEAQSKAMNVLSNMLAKFEDYRRRELVNEEYTTRVEILKSKLGELEKQDPNITVISNIPRAT